MAASRHCRCVMARQLFVCCWRVCISVDAIPQCGKRSPVRNRRSISHRCMAERRSGPERVRRGLPSAGDQVLVGIVRARRQWWEHAHGMIRICVQDGQLLLLDREDLAGLHLDLAHHAGAAAGVPELGVVGPGRTPVMRSRSSGSTVPSLSFLHWLGPKLVVPAGARESSEIVCRVRFQKRVGLLASAKGHR